MESIKEGMQSLSLLARLNMDRVLVFAMIAAALFAAGFMVTL